MFALFFFCVICTAIVGCGLSVAFYLRAIVAERERDNVPLVGVDLQQLVQECDEALDSGGAAFQEFQQRWTGRRVRVNGVVRQVVATNQGRGVVRLAATATGEAETFIFEADAFDIHVAIGSQVAIDATIEQVNPLGPLFVDSRIVMKTVPLTGTKP
ncbi:MAG: hypothetical protein AB7U73_01925 [Pirellulales bacterium]